jgi:hypothetical protein
MFKALMSISRKKGGTVYLGEDDRRKCLSGLVMFSFQQ